MLRQLLNNSIRILLLMYGTTSRYITVKAATAFSLRWTVHKWAVPYLQR